MKNTKKYLITGEEVELIREVEGGYLYSPVYYDSVDDYTFCDDTILFTEKLYDEPVTAKLHDDVKDLENKKEILKKELVELNKRISNETSLAWKVKEHEFIQMLIDYMNKDYEYIVYLDRFDMKQKSRIFHENYFYVENSKNGIKLILLSNGDYLSSSDRQVFALKDKESAYNLLKSKWIEILRQSTECDRYKWSDDRIKKHFNSIEYSELKKDKEVIQLYNDKLTEAIERQKKQKEDYIRKEIEEMQKKLESLK